MSSKASSILTAFNYEGGALSREASATALKVIKEIKHSVESKEQLLEIKSTNMRVLANRANSSWIHGQPNPGASVNGQLAASSPKERIDQAIKTEWRPPQVLDIHQFSDAQMDSRGVDMKMYQAVVPEILLAGKMAVQINFLGEEQILSLIERDKSEENDREGGTADFKQTVEEKELAIKLDLWAAIARLFPHRLPEGLRLNGLTLLDRQVIQTIVNVEKMTHSSSVSSLYILLSVDSSHTPWVASQVLARDHWGLEPNHLIIQPIAQFPGVIWNEERKCPRVSYVKTKHPFQPAGSGYSLLAAGWPGEAFWMNPVSKNRTYLNTSVLHTLSKAKVEYLYSSRLTDYAHLNLSSPTLDPAFLAPAIYAMDFQGASVAAEVFQGGSAALLRKLGIIAMSRVTDRNGTCLISASDLETIHGRSLVALANQQPGGMWGGNSRYLFKLDALINMVTSAKVFRWTLTAKAPCAYLSMDVVDLTHHLDFKCVAIAGKSQGPNVSVTPVSSEALREMATVLRIQDNQPSFRK